LAALLFEAKQEPLPGRIIVFGLESDHGADPGKGVGQCPEKSAIAEVDVGEDVDRTLFTYRLAERKVLSRLCTNGIQSSKALRNCSESVIVGSGACVKTHAPIPTTKRPNAHGSHQISRSDPCTPRSTFESSTFRGVGVGVGIAVGLPIVLAVLEVVSTIGLLKGFGAGGVAETFYRSSSEKMMGY
jgi:hypothetical protein